VAQDNQNSFDIWDNITCKLFVI